MSLKVKLCKLPRFCGNHNGVRGMHVVSAAVRFAGWTRAALVRCASLGVYARMLGGRSRSGPVRLAGRTHACWMDAAALVRRASLGVRTHPGWTHTRSHSGPGAPRWAYARMLGG